MERFTGNATIASESLDEGQKWAVHVFPYHDGGVTFLPHKVLAEDVAPFQGWQIAYVLHDMAAGCGRVLGAYEGDAVGEWHIVCAASEHDATNDEKLLERVREINQAGREADAAAGGRR